MYPSLTQWLACPVCDGELTLVAFMRGDPPDVEEGVLTCSCTSVFPVIAGVPRILEGALADNESFLRRWGERLQELGLLRNRALSPPSPEFEFAIAPTRDRFAKEWGEHPLEDTTWGLDQETRLRHALRYLGWTLEDAGGQLVLDAGCGTGKLTCGMASWGGEVIGLDLAPSLVRGWRARHQLAGAAASRIHMVQGSVLAPPFKQRTFDGVHSSGVLHHTPDTRRAFAAIAPLVKTGGSLGVWLYGQQQAGGGVPWLPFVRTTWGSIPTTWLRAVTPRMPPSILFAILRAYSALFHVIYSVAARLRGKHHDQTIQERTTSLFDTLSPPYAWRHTVGEVCDWFREEGFPEPVETTVPGETYGFCVTARKAVQKGTVKHEGDSN
jgi:SAM-dependent methyltransferase/uncharacterized protein YbaR (Trm112 family)